MHSAWNDAGLSTPGFPIRRSTDQSLLSGSPRLFAASHVLHRLLAPRHPPYALRSLTTLGLCHQMRFLRAGYPYAIVKELGTKCRMIRPFQVGSTMTDRAAIRHRAANTTNGADRNRTDGLRLARAALSHLSYSPESNLFCAKITDGPR